MIWPILYIDDRKGLTVQNLIILSISPGRTSTAHKNDILEVITKNSIGWKFSPESVLEVESWSKIFGLKFSITRSNGQQKGRRLGRKNSQVWVRQENLGKIGLISFGISMGCKKVQNLKVWHTYIDNSNGFFSMISLRL